MGVFQEYYDSEIEKWIQEEANRSLVFRLAWNLCPEE
jgi:hypothetical protein